MSLGLRFSCGLFLFAGQQRIGLRGPCEFKGMPSRKNEADLIEDHRAHKKQVEGNLPMLTERARTHARARRSR